MCCQAHTTRTKPVARWILIPEGLLPKAASLFPTVSSTSNRKILDGEGEIRASMGRLYGKNHSGIMEFYVAEFPGANDLWHTVCRLGAGMCEPALQGNMLGIEQFSAHLGCGDGMVVFKSYPWWKRMLLPLRWFRPFKAMKLYSLACCKACADRQEVAAKA